MSPEINNNSCQNLGPEKMLKMRIFCSLTKPTDFTECIGDELPVGWEQAYDYQRGGIYYVDHLNSKLSFQRYAALFLRQLITSL